MSIAIKFLFGYVLLVLAFSVRSYAQVSCGDSPSNPNNSLLDIKQMTSEAGWARSRCHLFWTSDNGQQWKDVTPPMSASQTLEGTVFVDETHGWAALLDSREATKTPFSLAVTEDGGGTWKTQVLNTSSLPDIAASHGDGVSVQLQLVDQMHGWVFFGTGSQLFSSGLLLETMDGGDRWTPLPTAPSAGHVVFATTSSGTLVSNSASEMWTTQDGGQSWTAVSFPLPPSCEQCRVFTIGKVRFPAPDAGFLTVTFFDPKANSYTTTSLTSTDQGRTWTPDQQDTKLIATVGAQLNSIADSHQLHISVSRSQRQIVLQTKSTTQTLPLPAVIGAKGDITDASFTSESSGWILYETHGCSPAHTAPCGHHVSVIMNLLSAARGVLTVITPPASGVQATPNQTTSADVFGSSESQLSEASVHPAALGSGIGNQTAISVDEDGLDEFGFYSASQVNFSKSLLQSWWNWSPYYNWGVYIGGINYTHGVPSLSTIETAAQYYGWNLFPIWVGHQAACINKYVGGPIPAGQGTATGTSDAKSAVSTMDSYLMSSGVIYLDIEQYTPSSTYPTCSADVKAYVDAFISYMHSYGIAVGVYGSGSNFSTTSSGATPTDLSQVPGDAAFVATTLGCSYTSNGIGNCSGEHDTLFPMYWLNNGAYVYAGQRMQQFDNPASPPTASFPSGSSYSASIDLTFQDSYVVQLSVPTREQGLPFPMDGQPNGSAVDANSSCCELSWEAVNGAIDGYQVVISSDPEAIPYYPYENGCLGSCEYSNETSGATALTFPATDYLTPNTLYYWAVRANGTYKPGYWFIANFSYCSNYGTQ